MKKMIKKILKEEVYNIFEDEEFDPLGHIGGEEKESDDPEELGIDLTEDCVLGFSNSNSKLEWPYFSLPAGYTCPFATVCKNFPAKWEGPVKGGKFNRPKSWEKNIKPGPEAKFMCYAARAQGQYPATNIRVFKNLNLLKQHKTSEGMANLILKSLRFHGLQDADIFRIHEAGDFFSQAYFDAWLEVARQQPGTLFYAYTVSLPYWIARKGQIPKNFKLIASMDEKNKQMVLDNDLRYSLVVDSVEEAKELGLPIDVDDSIAWGSDENFALLLHGPQPTGSEAAQALKRNKEAGMYGKEGVMSKAKQRNQAKKDALRDKIRRQLRGESILRENPDFEWIEELNPYQFVEDYYKDFGKGRVGKMAQDYAHLKADKNNITKLMYKMSPSVSLDKRTLAKVIMKYLKNNLPFIKRFMARAGYDSFDYSANELMDDLVDDKSSLSKMYNSYMDDDLEEDMVYWGTKKVNRDEYEMGPVTEANEWGGTGRDLNMRGHRDYENNVYVHRNLNAPPYFSIKKAGGATGGKVIGYDTSIHLRDVRFIVGERGNREVLPVEFGGEGKAKNVHAGAVGKHVSSGRKYDTSEGWRLVRYNPRVGHQTFIYADTEEPIHTANEAILKNGKEVWVR